MNKYLPIEYIKQDEEILSFLVMSARYDISLEVNAKHFVEKLKNYQHSVDYFTVTGTHGTIATINLHESTRCALHEPDFSTLFNDVD
ncbi:unnamed protein product [Rotaria sordida]|uniref:Uncharacterized protein n=1 Tax=Rotaria sordida TaxID=392033 RepID=A0A815QR40_9BILA|nr:unnamed protein product [Rotaria sordida]